MAASSGLYRPPPPLILALGMPAEKPQDTPAGPTRSTETQDAGGGRVQKLPVCVRPSCWSCGHTGHPEPLGWTTRHCTEYCPLATCTQKATGYVLIFLTGSPSICVGVKLLSQSMQSSSYTLWFWSHVEWLPLLEAYFSLCGRKKIHLSSRTLWALRITFLNARCHICAKSRDEQGG